MYILLGFIAAVLVCGADALTLYLYKKEKFRPGRAAQDLFYITLLSLSAQRYFLRYPHFLTGGGSAAEYAAFFAAALAVGAAYILARRLFLRLFRIDREPARGRRKAVFALKVCAGVLFFLGAGAFFGSVWGREAFGTVDGDQLLVVMTSPAGGTELGTVIDGLEGPVFSTVLATALFLPVLFRAGELRPAPAKGRRVLSGRLRRGLCCLLAAAVLSGGMAYGFRAFRLSQGLNAFFASSDLIEKTYVDPLAAEIRWPSEKRNLVYIYLESMENSYMSRDEGGFIDVNLIPNLTRIARDGVVFSDSDRYFGGPDTSTGTQWSVASMTNQLTGLPMKVTDFAHTYGKNGLFLPGANSLGELLEARGYEMTVMFGASGKFGSLRYLFENHGDWKLMDYDYMKQTGMIPRDYRVWWGVEDEKLFRFAKGELLRLHRTGKPFCFLMETADTHRPDGYVSPGRETPFDSPYANALWNSDRDVSAFLDWLRDQPFYENTTVVLIGDHLSMETRFFEDYGFTKDYKRTQFNCILNPAPALKPPGESVTRNRLWSNWDMLPTTVAALGGEIRGERLGIGTNLFSGEKTILEEYGADHVNRELSKGSRFYDERILRADGSE